MIDQSHNLKGKMEAMVQTVVTAQELYAKAALVDQARLAELQQECRLVEAEECFRGAFWQDVRPIVREWRVARGLPADPLKALAESGYVEKMTQERAAGMLVVFRAMRDEYLASCRALSAMDRSWIIC